MSKKIKICLLASLLIVLTMCGCSAKEKKQCQEQVTEFLTAYQNQEAACGMYLVESDENNTVKFEGFQSILAEPITFEIKSVKVDKDYYIVNTVIANVDFGSVVDGLVNSKDIQMETKEDIVVELEKRLKAENAPRREFDVPIKLNKEQKIQMTSELSNALLGGYSQYIYELTAGDIQ